MRKSNSWDQWAVIAVIIMLPILVMGWRTGWLEPPLPDAGSGFEEEPDPLPLSAFANVPAFTAGEPFDLSRARVIDGDTFALGTERVRISNIDAPETEHRAECLYEATGGIAATAELESLFHYAMELEWPAEIEREGQDRYGRTLALIAINGEDVGLRLARHHLAVPWSGRQHDWCANR